MLCLMFECPIRGVLADAGGSPWSDQEIAEAIGGPIGSNLECIAELLGKGVASRDNRDAIFSRRLVRDEEVRQATRVRVQRHRSNGFVTHPVTQLKRDCTEDETEDEAAKDLPPIALSQKVAAEVCLRGPGIIEAIAGAIEFLQKHEDKGANEAVKFLINKAREEIARGGAPDRFWFESRKWRKTGAKNAFQESLNAIDSMEI